MNHIIKKIIRLFQKHGIIDGFRIIIQKIKTKNSVHKQKRDLFGFYDYVNFPKAQTKLSSKDQVCKKLIWFIPDFGIGSGGHLNIFRMIFNLEKLGIDSDLVICGNSQWVNESIAKETISKNFFPLKSDIYFVKKYDDIKTIKNYYISFATSWQSAYYVNAFDNCARKAYFVQDFEPYFYAVGSSYIFAENTYRFGFEGITAGSWLSHKLLKEYNMKCMDFSFSYENNLYFKQEKKDYIKRIFFYARPPTERRGFELGILALNELYKKDNSIEIVLAGWDVSEYEIPFAYKSLGVVDIKDLSGIYAQCSVALVLSFTNLSLLPLELLASGCPVVINTGENNCWIDEKAKMMIYTEANVSDIVRTISNVIDRKITLDWNFVDFYLKNSSWEKESEKVYKWINNGIDN